MRGGAINGHQPHLHSGIGLWYEYGCAVNGFDPSVALQSSFEQVAWNTKGTIAIECSKLPRGVLLTLRPCCWLISAIDHLKWLHYDCAALKQWNTARTVHSHPSLLPFWLFKRCMCGSLHGFVRQPLICPQEIERSRWISEALTWMSFMSRWKSCFGNVQRMRGRVLLHRTCLYGNHLPSKSGPIRLATFLSSFPYIWKHIKLRQNTGNCFWRT